LFTLCPVIGTKLLPWDAVPELSSPGEAAPAAVLKPVCCSSHPILVLPRVARLNTSVEKNPPKFLRGDTDCLSYRSHPSLLKFKS